MVVIPPGRFRMGCLSSDDCSDSQQPVHEVSITAPFALSVYEVTFEDYDRFTYPNKVDDEGWGRGRRPVINVSSPVSAGRPAKMQSTAIPECRCCAWYRP